MPYIPNSLTILGLLQEKGYSFFSPAQGFSLPAQGLPAQGLPAQGFSCFTPLLESAEFPQETTPTERRDTARSMAMYLTFIIDFEFLKVLFNIHNKYRNTQKMKIS